MWVGPQPHPGCGPTHIAIRSGCRREEITQAPHRNPPQVISERGRGFGGGAPEVFTPSPRPRPVRRQIRTGEGSVRHVEVFRLGGAGTPSPWSSACGSCVPTSRHHERHLTWCIPISTPATSWSVTESHARPSRPRRAERASLTQAPRQVTPRGRSPGRAAAPRRARATDHQPRASANERPAAATPSTRRPAAADAGSRPSPAASRRRGG
jgi:hypothetical protein